MKKIIFVAIICIIIFGAWTVFRNKNTPSPEQIVRENPTASIQDTSGPSEQNGEVKEFAIDASNFQFSLKEIRVKEGDRLKIVLTSKQGFHDFVLDEFNARTGKVQAGETTFVEFVADKKGTFEYYCSIGTHRQLGMVGKLIIE